MTIAFAHQRVGPRFLLFVLAAFLVAACTGNEAPVASDEAQATTPVPGQTSTPAPAETSTETPSLSALEDDSEDGPFGRSLQRTLPDIDLTNRTVSLAEIVNGGVGADDGIPSIRDPAFESIVEAEAWLTPREPVILVEVNDEARIYPIQILMWHEVVNDELGGEPILVTFCPLCYTAIVFDRRVDGEVREFGVSGFLRESDLLVYDDQTSTLWQQLTGEGIVGTDAGKRLQLLPAQIVAFEDARRQFPDAQVLSRETGFDRAYGTNPYAGYDNIDSSPIFGTSFSDDRLPAKAQVLAVEYEGVSLAFPFTALSEQVVIEAEASGVPIVAFWQPGTSAALDSSSIAASRDIGAAGAFIAEIDGQRVSFEARDGAIYDVETGSRWNVLGAAVEGPLSGERLEQVTSGSHFWFIWSIFQPDTVVLTE